jgi:cation:H+ antiporter
MLANALLILIGMALLIKGSDWFVGAAATLAKKLGVSEFVIGLTLVAVGTSLPELASSVIASAKGESGLIVGTIAGANIANLGLIIGIAALISSIKTKAEMLSRDGYIMLFSFGVLYLFILTGGISRLEGIILLALFFAYTLFLLTMKGDNNFRDFAVFILKFGHIWSIGHKLRARPPRQTQPFIKDLIIMLTSGLLIAVGANWVVNGAVFFATLLLVPSTVLGILIAVGTTMPEISVAIAAAKKRMGSMIIGNALGSSIANTLLVMGTAALISPVSALKLSLIFVLPFMLFLGALLLLFIRIGWRIGRLEGAALLSLYFGFLGAILLNLVV